MACGLPLSGQIKVKIVIYKLTRYFLCDAKDILLTKIVSVIYI